MFDQIPASSELLIERPRLRRRVIVALVLFVLGSALAPCLFGSSVTAMSARWRNAGPADQDKVSVITLSRSIHDVFIRPTPTADAAAGHRQTHRLASRSIEIP